MSAKDGSTPAAGPPSLRVCIVTPHVTRHAIGGMQQHTNDLARGLVQAGHEAAILTSRVPAGPSPPDGVELHTADADRPSGVYDRRWGAASAALFEQLHRQRPFHVVHSEGGGAHGLIKHGVHRDVPLTVLFHGNWLGFVRAEFRNGWAARPRWHGLLKAGRHGFDMSVTHFGQGHWRAYRPFEAMVPSAAHLGDTIRSHGLVPERTHVVPNGVDVQMFSPGRSPAFRARLGVPSHATLLMTLGRLAADKGNDRALHAFATLARDDLRLAIVGDGDREPELRTLAQALGIAEQVVFAGALPQDEVPEALRAADVFWFPTVRDEAAPLVLPQALATGLPVVASRIGGIPEVVADDGSAGILVAPGDPTALAAATAGLLDEPERRSRVGVTARERAVTGFSIETMTGRTVAVYRIAIARHAAERSG
jgi:glycosyltransferase involved in cell wall biosynthesis